MSKESKDNKKLILLTVAAISLIILIVCIIKLALYSLSSYDSNKERDELKEKISESGSGSVLPPINNTENIPEDRQEKINASKYSALYKENNDFSGWIKIDGTNIDYPVMQTVSDEEYYLHRNFKKESADEGLPFIDARCDIFRPSANLIIYGHNMKNGDMFADLLKYDSKSYYEQHPTITFDSIFSEGTYKIISVFRTDVSKDSEEDFQFYRFVNDTSAYPLKTYLSEIKARSCYEIPFDENKVVGLITLSTCEYTKKDGRYVVIAAKMSDI